MSTPPVPLDETLAAYRKAQMRQARRTAAVGIVSIAVYVGALLEVGLRAIGLH